MEKIRDIYDECNTTLSSIIKTFKESLSTMSDMSSYKILSMSFTELVKNWQECVGLSELIVKCYEFAQHDSDKIMEDIQSYMTRYNKCKSRVFIIIGSLKDSTKSDVSDKLDLYISKCDELQKVDKLIQRNVSDTLNEMDLLEEGESEDEKKSQDSDDWDSETHSKQSKTSKTPDKHQKSQKNQKSVSGDLSDSEFNLEKEDSEKSDNSTKITENDLLGDDILNDAKTGGINELSNITVVDGGDDVVVGEKYKFYTRELFLKIKHSETYEEQIECAGFKSEDDLNKFVEKLDTSKYITQLVKECGVNELYVKSLESLMDRVNSYCSKMGNANQSINNRFKKVIKSVKDCIDDPFSSLHIDDSLYHLTKCFCAVKFENTKFINQIKLMDSIKLVLVELNDVLKKHHKSRELASFDTDIFTVDTFNGEDALKFLLQLRRKWIKPMTQLEIYLSRLSEYINEQWLICDADNLSIECAKYRLYLLNSKSTKLSKSDAGNLKKMIDKYDISDYGSVKKFIEATC